MKEQLKAIEEKLAAMKGNMPTAAASDEQLKRFFTEQEAVLEGLAKAVADLDEATTTESECLKDTVKSLKEELKRGFDQARPVGRKELALALGKTLAALWAGERSVLGEMKCVPNLGSDKWNGTKDFVWIAGKGFVRTKDALGDPVGNLATNDQYLLNPEYTELLLEYAAEGSCMMPLVTERRMKSASVYIDEDEGSTMPLTWLTSYGQQITGGKPESPERLELKAHTLAGYVSWYDEFDEDAFVDLGERFMRKFRESYAEEFDRQCLTADASPFTGALAKDGAASLPIASADASSLTYEDFRKAEMLVPAAERKHCMWFMHDTVLNQVTNLKDDDGRPLWRQPWEKMPGVIDGYEVRTAGVLPQLSELEADTPFAVFMNPANIIHGNRKEIELKRFKETAESLQYGQEFLRFRKRDGFLVTKAKAMCVLKTASE